MDELDYACCGTVDEQIRSLRTAAARCRLATATSDVDLSETLSAMADEYEATAEALINWIAAPGDERRPARNGP
ncbi:hypothetical protein [Bosea sp. Tri-44]|uniref:hypothetical protein n=1 Tax=Bosea sp. Tri-44 TaxID=1972137 RepID=UPI00100EDF89|nr:hypothetical protein [Bosea sp. Tri-44]